MADYGQMKLDEIAEQIAKHLREAEADREWNRREWVDRRGERRESLRLRLWKSGAFRAGRFVKVIYISFQGGTNLSKTEAIDYLRWLDAGNRGRHWGQQRGD